MKYISHLLASTSTSSPVVGVVPLLVVVVERSLEPMVLRSTDFTFKYIQVQIWALHEANDCFLLPITFFEQLLENSLLSLRFFSDDTVILVVK